MPQLDTFAYMSQVVWLFFGFFSMYIYLVRISLPRIYKILYVRRYKLMSYANSIKVLDKELFLLTSGMVYNGSVISSVLNALPSCVLNIKEGFFGNFASKYSSDTLDSFFDQEDYLLGGVDVVRLSEEVIYLEGRLGEDLKKRVSKG